MEIKNIYSLAVLFFTSAALTAQVGINTPSPQASLDVVGDTFGLKRSQGSGSWDNLWFDLSNSSAPAINASGAETGLQFKVGANAVGTYGNGQTLATVATMTSAGNVGIGSTAPTRKLHVEGAGLFNAAVTTSITKNALDINIGQDTFTYGNRIDNFGINVRSSSTVGGGSVARINFGDTSTGTAGTGKYLSFSVGNTLNELMYLTDNNSGRVGIGTITPSTKLHVESATAGALRIVDGTQGSNKLLISDGTGIATWKDPGENVYTQSGNSFGLLVNANFSTTSAVPAIAANYLFDAATVNVGNAYNTTTGVFTVPNSGIYSINAAINHVFVKNTAVSDFAGSYVYPQIKVTDASNNSILIRGSAAQIINGQITPGGIQYAPATISTTLPLKTGDKVEVIYNFYGGGPTISTVHPARMSGLVINRVQ